MRLPSLSTCTDSVTESAAYGAPAVMRDSTATRSTACLTATVCASFNGTPCTATGCATMTPCPATGAASASAATTSAARELDVCLVDTPQFPPTFRSALLSARGAPASARSRAAHACASCSAARSASCRTSAASAQLRSAGSMSGSERSVSVHLLPPTACLCSFTSRIALACPSCPTSRSAATGVPCASG